LINRGGAELPIRPDMVGADLPLQPHQAFELTMNTLGRLTLSLSESDPSANNGADANV